MGVAGGRCGEEAGVLVAGYCWRGCLLAGVLAGVLAGMLVTGRWWTGVQVRSH